MLSDDSRIPLLTYRAVVGYTIIDNADAAWVRQWKWHPLLSHGNTYAYRTQSDDAGTSFAIYLHRELLGLPRRQRTPQADHIDRDGLNNRRENLRVVTLGQNLQNKNLYRNNTSGFRGVAWDSGHRAYHAYGYINRVMYNLGFFKNIEEAAAVAQSFRLKHMTHATD